MSVNKPSLVNQTIYVNWASNQKPVENTPQIEPKTNKKKLAVGIAAAAGIGALVLGGILYAKGGRGGNVKINPTIYKNECKSGIFSRLVRKNPNSSEKVYKICTNDLVYDILSDKPRIKGVTSDSLGFVFTDKRFIVRHPKEGKFTAKDRKIVLKKCIECVKREIEVAKAMKIEGADKISEKLPEFLEKFESQI